MGKLHSPSLGSHDVTVEGGVTVDPAAAVADAAALTSAADLGGTYDQAEVNKLRADVAALRTKVNALLAALRAADLLDS